MYTFFIQLLINTVYAQADGEKGSGVGSIIKEGINEGCNFKTGDITALTCIPAFIAHLIKWIFGFAGSICLILIMWGGYEIVAGNLPGGSAESGKNRITWAIIGFILSATSFYIMDFVIAAISGGSLVS